MKTKLSCCILVAVLFVFSQPVAAHMPSIERWDFNKLWPFQIRGTIEKGLAVYAYLNSGSDVDVYRFVVSQKEISEKGGVRLRVRANMPACKDAPEFLPWLAVAGPGLPQPTEDIPFTLRAGYGAVVVKNTEPGAERNYFYEQYSKKSYYIMDNYEYTITEPGIWYLYYWDPYKTGGDYLAVWGVYDEFSPRDQRKMSSILPDILSDAIMHSECDWIMPEDIAGSAASSICLQ